MQKRSVCSYALSSFLCFAYVVFISAPGPAYGEQTLYPSENPSPNGAYIRCVGQAGDCWDLRDTYYNANTQIEHIADRLLLRTGGKGVLVSHTEIVPLSWSAPGEKKVIVKLEDGKGATWEFSLRGAFLESPEGETFIFVRSEAEYEDSEGGILTIP